MRIYLAGSKAFGADVYRALALRDHEIVGGSTPPWASDGERRDQLRVLIEDHARSPWLPAGELRAALLPADTDLIVCAHSHDFIGRATRHRARIGAIGYHPSLLPRHRGRAAVEWTIRMKDPVAGGSVYWLDDRIDAGPLAAQALCHVLPGDTARELWERDLFPMGVRLLMQVVGDLDNRRLVQIPQDERAATWEPALDPPRLRRPDLPELGTGGYEGFTIIRER